MAPRHAPPGNAQAWLARTEPHLPPIAQRPRLPRRLNRTTRYNVGFGAHSVRLPLPGLAMSPMLTCAVDATARNSIRKDQSKGAPHVKKVSFGIRAFTLIELLIVVAIIAILAAIAVPNFLEAQVRAKVSRARADMRSAATAIEARAVDKNGGHGQTYTLMRMYADPTYPARPVHDFVEGGAIGHSTKPPFPSN